MTKIAVLGDTHIDCRNSSLLFSQYQEKFYNDIFFPEIDKRNIKTIVQLGDVFDRRKYVNFVTLGRSKYFLFDKLNNYDTHIIVGNHDIPYRNSLEHNSPSLLLQEYPNIKVYSEATETHIGLLLPWICQSNIDHTLNMIKQSTSRICYGHLEIEGFEMYKGTKCDNGFKPDLFKKFDKVLSGHFHHKSDNKGIFYLGSPYQLTWSDCGDVRGFHIFDTETEELEFIENPYEMFHKIYYNDETNDIFNIDLNKYQDAYVKIIVVNKQNPYGFDSFITNLYNADIHDLTIVEQSEDIEVSDVSVNEAEDTLTILSNYIDQLSINADKKQLVTLMRTLYNEAMETT